MSTIDLCKWLRVCAWLSASGRYGKVSDVDQFESVVIAALKFEEDRKEVRDALGL